jgi:hypothetical protein
LAASASAGLKLRENVGARRLAEFAALGVGQRALRRQLIVILGAFRAEELRRAAALDLDAAGQTRDHVDRRSPEHEALGARLVQPKAEEKPVEKSYQQDDRQYGQDQYAVRNRHSALPRLSKLVRAGRGMRASRPCA